MEQCILDLERACLVNHFESCLAIGHNTAILEQNTAVGEPNIAILEQNAAVCEQNTAVGEQNTAVCERTLPLVANTAVGEKIVN